MDFTRFDTRNYPTVDAARGYGEWAATYDGVVRNEMDLRLLERVLTVPWSSVERAVDLACGTGRIGAWLDAQGVSRIDGIDITPEMIDQARARSLYGELRTGDVCATAFDTGVCDLVTMSLADEHLAELGPLYSEVARLLRPGGAFVLVGYHPQFLR